ncbi:MAG: thiol-disulfide isomerase/thioredoxin [Salibacteraceae bacterium]|jgi:thiol-disulfide isomerase/thioredoxin
MKYIHILFLSLIIGTFSSCEEPHVKPDSESSISGYLDNIPGTQLTLVKQTPAGLFPIDSVYVQEDGYFEFTTPMEDIAVYRVMIDFAKYLTVAIQKGDHITLEADGLDLYRNYYVAGSPESELIQVVVYKTMELGRKMDSIKIDINHQKPAKDSKGLFRSFQAQKDLFAGFNLFSVNFIEEHPGSIAAYFVVAGLQPDENPNEFLKVAEHLNKTYPNFAYLSVLNENASFLKKVVLNELAPELNYPNPQGVEIALSSLKGNYVLLDFWASWCRPCRMENPNFVKLYHKYKDQGLQIYGYSLDEDKEKWIEAIAQDGLTWIQTSELKGWSAQGALDYGIQSIPATFLIDPNGNIISRDAKGTKLVDALNTIYGF